MRRREFLKTSATMGVASGVAGAASACGLASGDTPLVQDAAGDRRLWVETLVKISRPVLTHIAAGTLQKSWPVEYSLTWDGRNKKVAYLEAFGRLTMGVAPWLALPDDATSEGRQRRELAALARAGVANAVDPVGPDYVLWREEAQPLVDAAYLAEAFMRAPAVLWEPLDATVKARVITEFRALRRVVPFNSNWMLFAAMVESCLQWFDDSGDQDRIDTALSMIESWYVGDGWYSDGPRFHMDYYNSYVIHSMLVDVLAIQKAVAARKNQPAAAIQERYDRAVKRMRRFAEFVERLISPEGTYPAFGRSITYRTAVFQSLGHAALLKQLPDGITPGQVRAGMTAVIRRMFAAPGVFDSEGWLTLGFAGHQPSIADYYSSAGSMYICALGFAPLGLPATDPFWTAPAEDWTARKAWSGQPFNKDYAVEY